MKKNLPQIAEQAPDTPLLLHKILQETAAGKLEVEWKSADLRKLQEDLRRANRATLTAINGGTLVIAATLLISLGPGGLLSSATASTLGMLLGGAGVLLLVRSWLRY